MTAQLASIVMGPMMVIASRYDLAALHHDCTQSEYHGALRGRISTLRQIVLCLVHLVVHNRGRFRLRAR